MMSGLVNKNILLGVCGSIAAYKAVYLTRLLMKEGTNVKIVMTEAATKFVTPLTFETLTRNKVYISMFEKESYEIDHIALNQWADIIVVAPATADLIARISCGRAEDLLSSLILAKEDTPLILAPGMNTKMWKNPITQRNINTIKQFLKAKVIEPKEGELACKEEGVGRMAEPDEILSYLKEFVTRKNLLKGLKILVTAGPTQEDIDPIRFITNRSSGKMGYSIAEKGVELGATVTLITGPTNLTPPSVHDLFYIRTARELYDKVISIWQNFDVIIMAAAVLDFSPIPFPHKLKKENLEELTITLKRNPDILKTIGELKGDREKPVLVGFSLESEELEKNSLQKLKEKNCDIIIGNWASEALGKDTNRVTIYKKDLTKIELPELVKSEVAEKILLEIYKLLKDKT